MLYILVCFMPIEIISILWERHCGAVNKPLLPEHLKQSRKLLGFQLCTPLKKSPQCSLWKTAAVKAYGLAPEVTSDTTFTGKLYLGRLAPHPSQTLAASL